jgi:hypothetical protein
MSHDSIKLQFNPKPRVICKSRVIAGILSEMEAAEATILIRSSNTNNSIPFKMNCDFRLPFEESTIRLSGEAIKAGTYQATVLFAGQRILFEIHVNDQSGICQFPRKIDIIDLRQSKRRTFGPESQTAEIFSNHVVIFAVPVDLSLNSLALVSAVSDPPLRIGEQVAVRIRGGVDSKDVFSSEMEVKDVDRSSATTRILLGMIQPKSRDVEANYRRLERKALANISLQIVPMDHSIGEPLTVQVKDISLTGLMIECDDSPKVAWLTPGLHIKLDTGVVHATVMWRDGQKAGLRLDALDESRTLSSWFDVLTRLIPANSIHHSQVDDLVNLFTESGLLKGSRRKVYGTRPGKFLPPETVTGNPLLYHRFASHIEGGIIASQLSMVRLTDEFWCIQEGSHNGETSALSYDEIAIRIFKIAENLAKGSLLAPRFFGGLIHGSVKSSVNIMEKMLLKTSNYRYEAFHLSLTAQSFVQERKLSDLRLADIRMMPAEKRRQVANSFDATLFEIFSGLNGSHPRLNSELSKLGPSHHAKTFAISLNNSFLGLAYRLSSYYTLSSTGVINSLFFVIKEGIDPDVVYCGINQLQESGLMRGTDDIVLIMDKTSETIGCTNDTWSKELNSSFKNLKPFALYVIDALLGV